MTKVCVTHGLPACVGAEADDCEIVTIPTRDDDRYLLAQFVAAQLIVNALATAQVAAVVPLLDVVERGPLIENVRGIADDLRESAGEHGADLWKNCQ